MANNQLKYRRVDGAARTAYQARWNKVVLWPLALAIALLAAGIWPAVSAYRRRLRAQGL